MKRNRIAPLSLAGPRFDTALVVLYMILLFSAMHVWSEPFALSAALLAVPVCIGRTPWRLARERFSVPVVGFLAFVVLYGAAAIYSPFGGSAVRDFRGMLPAFAVAAVLLFRVEKRHIRGLLWGVAALSALLSLVCTSFACDGPLYHGFCAVLGWFGQADIYRFGINNLPGRVNGIYNDANISASILAIGTLISLYLVQTEKLWQKRLAACVLVSASALGILLSVSRGAILCFGLSLLVWLAAAGRGRRLRLFLLMVIAAAVTGAAFLTAMPAVAAGAVLPNLLAFAAGAVIFLLDWAVGERLAGLLEGRGKVAAAAVGVVAVGAIAFGAAALTMTEPYVFGADDILCRVLPLSPGEYTLTVDWEGNNGNASVNIFSRSREESLIYSATGLYGGPLGDDISFTVPEDAKQVFFYFGGSEGVVFRSAVLSDGTEIPMGYRLLPEGIARRLEENLFLDNSFLLRVQYMKDALKIFMQRPIFGYGLGSTDNLYPAVQPFYYTSRYVHNYILQLMADTGILGTAAFLAFVLGSLWLLVRQLRRGGDMLAAVLTACWVMINSHSFMEINFSVQAYQCAALVLLLLPVILYAEPVHERAAKIGGAAVCGVFWVYLAVFGALLGSRQMVQLQFSTMRPGSMDELMASFESFAKRDVFESERYELEYVTSAVQNTEGKYDVKMLDYVEKIRSSGNYPTCAVLPEYYYLPIRDFKELFACSQEALLQRASYADIWDERMSFYRTRVLPAAGAEHMEDFVDGILGYQELLNEVNGRLLTKITLSGPNQAFLDQVVSAVGQGMSNDALYSLLASMQ